MKAYVKNWRYAYYYPEDMEKILDYLNENGMVQVSRKSVENFYHEFSQDNYGVGWKAPEPEIIAEFADWLSEIDI